MASPELLEALRLSIHLQFHRRVHLELFPVVEVIPEELLEITPPPVPPVPPVVQEFRRPPLAPSPGQTTIT